MVGQIPMYVLTRAKMLMLIFLVTSSWALALFTYLYHRGWIDQQRFAHIGGVDSSVQVTEIQSGVFKLPAPVTVGTMSVEEAIFLRRSKREYLDKPLELSKFAQLLWSSQGMTEPRWGLRTAPSAGGTYPLEIYAVVGENCVKGLASGIYRYNPKDHTIVVVTLGDFREKLSAAALNQQWIAKAPVSIVIAAVYERTTRTYGSRGTRYADMEAGHVGQNLYLIATAMSLGAVVVGAFHDEEVQSVLGIPRDQIPLYIVPVGYPKE